MAFYVGQRVRIVYSFDGRYVGSETTITALNVVAYTPTGTPDVGHEIDIRNRDGLRYVARPGWLAPIQDPGRQVVSWEGSIWMPEHMREGAPESEGVQA